MNFNRHHEVSSLITQREHKSTMKILSRVPSVLALIAFALGTFSCEEFLNVTPDSQVSDDQFWQNETDAESGVAAIYDAMQASYRTQHFLWGEFRSDNHIASDRVNGNNQELIDNDLTPANAPALRWNNLYLMISRANLAIERIPTIPNFNRTLLGEAHALRAYAYFDAVRVWGDVPLFTEFISRLDQDLTRSRTSAQTIFDEIIIPDMLSAEELIATPSGEFRFTKASVFALQAHVYMWLKDYAKANEAIQKLIDLRAFSLVTNPDAWQDLFLSDLELGQVQAGPELIFSIRYNLLEDGNRASGNYSLFFAGVPSFFINPDVENRWAELFPLDSMSWTARYPDFDPPTYVVGEDTVVGDYRYYFTREDREIGAARVAKYSKQNFNANFDDTNTPVYRYAGILLLKALAENRLNNPDEALALVNQIRDARNLPQVTADEFGGDVDSREVYILNERQLELFAEGDRWWDLRMTDRVQETLQDRATITDERLLFPIWEQHLVDNENLTQNPGY